MQQQPRESDQLLLTERQNFVEPLACDRTLARTLLMPTRDCCGDIGGAEGVGGASG